MLTFLGNLWAVVTSGLNKYYAYVGLALLFMAGVTVAYLHVQASGAQKEKLRHLQDALSTRYKEAQDRAKIQSTTSADARDRLLNRWSAN